jgi:hypothetical protein
VTELNIGQIVETGTFRATTTAYFAQTGLPVYSIEVSPKFYEYSKLRLKSARNVFLYHGDSASRLLEICSQLADKERPTFVYLDSHWREYLPLRDEIEILSKHLPNSIAMIDDFEVPGDPGYGFDDYGGSKRLSVSYLAGSKTQRPFFVYFPAAPSSKETGRKRGTCVVVFNPELKQHLNAFDLLRFYGSYRAF